MRNRLVHEYFGVDLGEVFMTPERALPGFKRTIEGLLHLLHRAVSFVGRGCANVLVTHSA
jgi:uncharacterized protein with HEPN domain